MARLPTPSASARAPDRYPLRTQGRPGGRRNKPYKAEPPAQVIARRISSNHPHVVGEAHRGPPTSRLCTRTCAPNTTTRVPAAPPCASYGGTTPRRACVPSAASSPPPGARARGDWGEFAALEPGRGRRSSTPPSWSGPTRARPCWSGAAAWTSSAGPTPTARRSAAPAASPLSCASTTSRRASPVVPAPGRGQRGSPGRRQGRVLPR